MAEKFIVMAGPCAIESEEKTLFLAEQIQKIMEKFDLDYYFKASWDKANRTKAENYRGPGLEEGLRILQNVKDHFGLRVVTDIHEPWQAKPVSEVADILQGKRLISKKPSL